MTPAGRPPPLRMLGARAMEGLRSLVGAPGEAESIRKNLFRLISTTPGERRFRRDYGCDIKPLFFEPVGTAMLEEMRRRVGAAILCWEPRIELTDVQVRAGDPELPALLVEVDYRSRSNGLLESLVRSVQLPG